MSHQWLRSKSSHDLLSVIRVEPHDETIDPFAVGSKKSEMRVNGIPAHGNSDGRVSSVIAAAPNEIEHAPELAIRVVSEVLLASAASMSKIARQTSHTCERWIGSC